MNKVPLYSFKNGLYTIEDTELNLFHKEPWHPAALPDEKVRGTQSPQGHFLEIFAQAGTPYAYAWIKDRQPDGEYLLVYADGSIKGRQYYKNGLLHGPSIYLTAKGHHLADAWFIDGKQAGRSTWYYPDGMLYSRQIHLNGLWHNKQLFYYRDGKIKSELSYLNGKLHGTTILYFLDSSPERILNYDNGTLLNAEVLPPPISTRKIHF